MRALMRVDLMRRRGRIHRRIAWKRATRVGSAIHCDASGVCSAPRMSLKMESEGSCKGEGEGRKKYGPACVQCFA
jgi:hypothetical protein